MAITVELKAVKETKNTIKFEESNAVGEPGDLLKMMYVPKETLALIGNPAAIKVTVEAA